MAERQFWNEAVLRRQIVTASPELRALEAQIRACAEVKSNNASIAERKALEAERKAKDRQYAKLVEEYGNEEKFSDELTNAERYAKKLETQRVLKEQMAEKAALKAQLEAEKTLEMMSEVDEDKLLKNEKKEKTKEQLLNQRANRDFLVKQTQMKELRRQEEELQDKSTIKQAEEYNLKTDLLKEIERQKQEMERLSLNQRELSLVKQLERVQERQDTIENMRLELEVLEKQAEEKAHAEERKMREATAKTTLKEGWDNQIRWKQEGIEKEEQKEAEYRKLLLEVLAEEARLDSLVAEARRRRQLDHRYLVDRLLEERRAMRATLVRRREEEDRHALEYENLRSEILEEEEKQLLLKHAPQLMPYYTPKLLSKLRQL